MNTRFSSSTASFSTPVETTESKSATPKRDTLPSKPLRVQINHHHVLKFTADEDDFLKKGIDRHGFGQWMAMLRDPDLKFQDRRTVDSLKKKARMKMPLG